MDMYGYKDASDEPLQSDLSAILLESLQMDGNEQGHLGSLHCMLLS